MAEEEQKTDCVEPSKGREVQRKACTRTITESIADGYVKKLEDGYDIDDFVGYAGLSTDGKVHKVSGEDEAIVGGKRVKREQWVPLAWVGPLEEVARIRIHSFVTRCPVDICIDGVRKVQGSDWNKRLSGALHACLRKAIAEKFTDTSALGIPDMDPEGGLFVSVSLKGPTQVRAALWRGKLTECIAKLEEYLEGYEGFSVTRIPDPMDGGESKMFDMNALFDINLKDQDNEVLVACKFAEALCTATGNGLAWGRRVISSESGRVAVDNEYVAARGDVSFVARVKGRRVSYVDVVVGKSMKAMSVERIEMGGAPKSRDLAAKLIEYCDNHGLVAQLTEELMKGHGNG